MPGTVLKLKLLILDGLQVHDTKSPASYRPNRELLTILPSYTPPSLLPCPTNALTSF